MLFQKGDAGDALFGVRRGQVRIETGSSDGSRLTLNFMGPGDLFGEVAVLDGQIAPRMPPPARPANCSCCGAKIFSPSSNASRRWRSSSSRCCASASAGERAYGGIHAAAAAGAAGAAALRAAADFGSEVHISQEQLGVFVGAARESVNRQLQLWRKDGILDLQRGRYPAAEHNQADGGGEERIGCLDPCHR